MKMIKVDFKNKRRGEFIIKDHPPKKMTANKKLINIIWAYSAKKNKAKVIEEYSTLYPDTSSDSPSVKSKGALFVSAKQDIKNINAAGIKGRRNHVVCSWICMMFIKFIDPEQSITEITIKPMETS